MLHLLQKTLAPLRRVAKDAGSMLGYTPLPPHKKISRFWQIVEIAGFAIGALSFVTLLAVRQHYLQSPPQVAQLEHGQLVMTVLSALWLVGFGTAGYVMVYKRLGNDKSS